MIRRWLAARKLQRIVDAKRNAPATVQYRKRVAAYRLGQLRKPVSQ